MNMISNLRLKSQDPRFWLLYCLLAKCLWAIGVITLSGIALVPDEAQYWTWSKALDWGYYSKPPGIAWQIWLGTFLLGDTELGIRITALGMNVLLCLATYHLGLAAGTSRKAAVWAAACLGWAPLGLMGSFLTTTDGGFVLFWTLACVVLLRKEEPNFLQVGVLVAAGALFKWPIYILWVLILLFWRCHQVILGVLVSLMGLLPSIVWNIQHHWPTFRHVHHAVTQTSQGLANPIDFMGAQLGLVTPIFFLLMLSALVPAFRSKNKGLVFLATSFSFMVLIYGGAAFTKKMQGNWAAFIYPGAFVCMAWYAVDRHPRLLHIGLGLSVAAGTLVVLVPKIQQEGLAPIPYSLNPFRHAMGWRSLTKKLDDLGYDPSRHFLAAEKYQETSILSFYGSEKRRAHFFNLHGARKNQFCYWPEDLPQSGFFVLTENAPRFEKGMLPRLARYEEELLVYFDEVQLMEAATLFKANGRTGKGACVFFCSGFRGVFPQDPEVY